MPGNHPVLGQFLSPDPFISDPSSTMGYNRYAYCNYNPLKFTDPSGYKICYENEPPQEWWVRVPDMHGYIGYYRGGGGGGFGGGTGFYGRSNSNSGGYHYTGNGTYENSSGESVNYWEVYHSLIVPFASYGWVCVTPRISANEGRTWSYGNGQLVFRPGANINYNSPGVDNASGGGGVIDDATSPFVGLGFKVVEDIGDDIFRGLGSGGKAVNRYYGPAANIWGGYNMVKTANNPNISNTRKAYDLAKNGIPIGIDVAIMFGLLESTPAGWIGTGIGVTMEGAELFYDKVYTPAMNYLLDYSNRWDQWFINGGYTNFYSDQRLKTEITEIDSTLEKLLLLHAYRFKWKTNNTNNDIGLLAQEVESVFPELVFKDSLGYKQIAYHKLVPILLQAIREQDLIIKQQNDSIEKYNQQLKEQEVLLNDVIQRLNKIEKNK